MSVGIAHVEKSIALVVFSGFDSCFRDLAEIRCFIPKGTDAEYLGLVKRFIEKNAFVSREKIDLNDEKIQELFDLAVRNAIQKDCQKERAAQQEAIKLTKLMEESITHEAQEKLYRKLEQTRLEKMGDVVKQLAEAALKKGQTLLNPQVEEKSAECAMWEEEDGLVTIEAPDAFSQRVIALCNQWEKDPSSIPFSEDTKRDLSYFRNELLKKQNVVQ